MPENILILADWRLAAIVDDTMPPRDPNNDDDDKKDEEDDEDEERDDEPPVVREPEPDDSVFVKAGCGKTARPVWVPAAALGSLPQGPMDYSDGKGRIEVAEHRCR